MVLVTLIEVFGNHVFVWYEDSLNVKRYIIVDLSRRDTSRAICYGSDS